MVKAQEHGDRKDSGKPRQIDPLLFVAFLFFALLIGGAVLLCTGGFLNALGNHH